MNAEQNYNEFKEKVRQKIAEIGVTEASRIIGIDKSFIHRFKSRKINLSAEVLFRFGRALGLLSDSEQETDNSPSDNATTQP